MSKSVKELRKEAKERGLKGYSTLSKDQLIQLLNGEMIEKKLRKIKNQRKLKQSLNSVRSVHSIKSCID